MIDQITDILRIAITLLFQLVLVTVLVALLMGEAAGSYVTSVYGNVRELLASLNPAAVAVAAVLYLFWQLHRNRIA
ncbi:MAG: hypothetical protein K8F90_04640 [Hyphomicrobiales bacterium]|nr:hypothetical protein [Hyphomicrobiales bacterium]